MQIPDEAVLLRIFIGENDRHRDKPLFEAIVLKAREMHLAGATVLRGPMGYGHSSRLHTSKILRLSEDLPLVIEIVDSSAKVDEFLPVLDGMMTSGLVTTERVRVVQYGKTARSNAGGASRPGGRSHTFSRPSRPGGRSHAFSRPSRPGGRSHTGGRSHDGRGRSHPQPSPRTAVSAFRSRSSLARIFASSPRSVGW